MLASKPGPCHHLLKGNKQRPNKPIRSQVNLCSSSNFREIPNLSLTHHVASHRRLLHLRLGTYGLLGLISSIFRMKAWFCVGVGAETDTVEELCHPAISARTGGAVVTVANVPWRAFRVLIRRP